MLPFHRSNAQRVTIALRAAALCAALLLGAATVATAEPTIPEKRRQAEAILTQVQELDAEVGAAAERYNGAQYRLAAVAGRLVATRRDLARTRGQLGEARSQASERLVEMYTEGQAPSALEVVLGAESFANVIDVIDTNERVAAQDVRIISDVKRLEHRTRRREQQLLRSRSRQQALVRERAAERDAIAARLSERQALLASVRVEVQRLEARERARQVELRRRAEAELVRQQALAAEQARRKDVRTGAPAAEQTPEAPVEPAAPAEPTPPTTAASEPAPAPTPPAPPPPPVDAGKGARVVAIAMRYLGIPYRWGGASPSSGFDCSGLTMYVFAQVGVDLPHYAAAQYGLGRSVSRSELQPGDLVFFRGLGHMGMYIGGGNMIHAPRTGDVVKISSLSESYYVSNWVGARRVL